ncbi:putative DNA polymerase III, clamp loader complex, gamma/delta/delta subunit [Helianthus debilis subsp. tardiflorus]
MARRGTNTYDSSSDVSFRQRAHRIGHCTSLVCPIPTDPTTVSVSMTFGKLIRGKLYELLVNCIPPEIILKRLLYELLKKLDFELKHEVYHWAAYYEHRMRLGQKAIFHIDGKIL